MITLRRRITDSVRIVRYLRALAFGVSRLTGGVELSGSLSTSTGNPQNSGQQKGAAQTTPATH